MSITRVALSRYAQPLSDPWPSPEGPVTRRHGLILFLEDDGGRVGCGESAPFPGFGLETLASSEAALRLAARRLVGLPSDAYREAAANLRWLAPVAACPAARHAIDLALHDLAAQAVGVSVARLLGGDRALEEVEANAAIPRVAPERAETLARSAVEYGARTIKVKIGSDRLDEDLARLRAVREVVGPEVRLRADANQAWNEEEAIAALRALAPFGLEYVEQPVAAEAIEVMARVRGASGVAVAADESVASVEAARRLLHAEAADVFIVKPMVLGGLHAAGEVAAMAGERGVATVVTSLLESAVGRAGALHFAASLGPGAHAHGVAGGWMPGESSVEAGPERGGTISVSAGPGLGLDFPAERRPAAERLAVVGAPGERVR